MIYILACFVNNGIIKLMNWGIEGHKRQNDEKFLPDLLEIDGTGGIKIEHIRELAYKLSLKPYQAAYKIAVIDQADQMTIEAANALLKVLEEPKPYTIIILISSNPNRLPKTIISRTQKINFGPLTPQDQEPQLPEGLEDYEKDFEIFSSDKMSDRLIMAASLAELETTEIKSILENWLERLMFRLRLNASDDLVIRIKEASKALRYLEQNVNSKLLLTNLMLKT
jgi:DNA polymerase III delta prime subunit